LHSSKFFHYIYFQKLADFQAHFKDVAFLGKGGTGKSTASALLSLVLIEKGKKALLASFDDARLILEQLNFLNIETKSLICNNRMQKGLKIKKIETQFSSPPIQHIPYSFFPLIGISVLKHHIGFNNLSFGKIF